MHHAGKLRHCEDMHLRALEALQESKIPQSMLPDVARELSGLAADNTPAGLVALEWLSELALRFCSAEAAETSAALTPNDLRGSGAATEEPAANDPLGQISRHETDPPNERVGSSNDVERRHYSPADQLSGVLLGGLLRAAASTRGTVRLVAAQLIAGILDRLEQPVDQVLVDRLLPVALERTGDIEAAVGASWAHCAKLLLKGPSVENKVCSCWEACCSRV